MTQAILFDLDGTLADTAPDLGNALNRQLTERGHQALPISVIRKVASSGARGLIGLGFNLTPEDAGYEALKDEFLNYYEAALCQDTRLFDGMAELLDALDARHLPWGIVTNKSARFTVPLMAQLDLSPRAACVVSGDTTPHLKPHPASLLHASEFLRVPPPECIYVGDDHRDVQAALAAGMLPVVALFGYLGNGHDPKEWGAKHYIDTPLDLLKLL